jgi:hypothetical protein
MNVLFINVIRERNNAGTTRSKELLEQCRPLLCNVLVARRIDAEVLVARVAGLSCESLICFFAHNRVRFTRKLRRRRLLSEG